MNKEVQEKIINELNKKIDWIKKEYDLVVVKGTTMELLNMDEPNLEDILEDKGNYLIQLLGNKRIITYEEFLTIAESAMNLFKKIAIIDNNLYMNWYPLTSTVNEDLKKQLINHFDTDSTDDSTYIGDLSDYLNIYGNYSRKDYVVYNDIVFNEKVDIINLFDNVDKIVKAENTFSEDEIVLELIDEEDYLVLLEELLNEPGDINLKKFSFDMADFSEKIIIIQSILKGISMIKIGLQDKPRSQKKYYPEYEEILQKYWGFSGFLDLPNYDLSKLEDGKKEIYMVSQGEIIESIVEQSTKAIKSKEYQDIFVTASTGSGKSAIFQIPAIHIAEKYGLFTIVISPLIGLMNDQVKNLEIKNYSFSRTINSDMSPIKKQEILEEIAENKCHILYISPETLLSRSDISQLIGSRKIGLFVIDEAHIVTTWGKQFRPDYWFLGDHIKKIRKNQAKAVGGHSFPIATFTATAIYNGVEDMYKETKNSLHMPNPLTYLGYIKRNDIDIVIDTSAEIKNKNEYELDKFDKLIAQIRKAKVLDKKMLVYFPTVALIGRFYDYCKLSDLENYVTVYHGQLDKNKKAENYEMFLSGERSIMLATKAFGMGIDIDDIEIIVHFAPTGNVCDYVQEIGRAARRTDLEGEAYYNYMKNDFKHINRLHGISIVKEYQLVEVIKKVNELFKQKLKSGNKDRLTKKGRSMLIDADSFSYIFENSFSNNDDAMNKVKTAMLIIQKDFEQRKGFAPFTIRPIPLFSIGYFQITKDIRDLMVKQYPGSLKLIDKTKEIVSVNLEMIWEKSFENKMSFPKFKYLLFSRSPDLKFTFKDQIDQALMVDISYQNNHLGLYSKYKNGFEDIIYNAIREEKYYSVDELARKLSENLSISIYSAKTITEVFIGAMQFYARDYRKLMNGKLFMVRNNNDSVKFRFNNPISEYFKWIERMFRRIIENSVDGKMFLVNKNTSFKEYLLVLGLLEIFGVLSFKSLGGDSSQIYIYVNETKSMDAIANKPYIYKNRLLEIVNQRHKISVATLSFLFDSNLSSEKIWGYLEDYFLGIIPEEIIEHYKNRFGEELDLRMFN